MQSVPATQNASSAMVDGQSVRLTDITIPHPKPAKLFQFSHQPTNAEEKAIWDWWFYTAKHDADFQWKTPIEFYGRVLDQHQQPVIGARVKVQWSTIGATPERDLLTDSDGKFHITGINGKGISAMVICPPGYTSGQSGYQSFEYSAFWETRFHVPDQAKPVLFRLWRFADTEPMYFWDRLKKMTVDGQKVWFDTKTGKFGPTGDVAFSTKRGATYAPHQFDWSMTVETAPGGGLALSVDDLMFEAPEGGYQPSWTHELSGKEPSYTVDKGIRFYLKTSDGKYAAVKADITHMGVPEAEVNVLAYVNPSGSRNLQYDAKKRLPSK